MLHCRSTQDHAACDVDEITRRNKIAQHAKNKRHRFPWKNVSRKKYTRQYRQKSELHRLALRIGLARNQYSQRQRNENIRQRQKHQQNHAPMDRHPERKPHRRQNEAQLKESNPEIRQQLAKQKPIRLHRRYKKLLERAPLLFPNNRKRRQESRNVQQQNRRKSRQKKIWRPRIRVKQKLRPHIHRECRPIRQNPPQQFTQPIRCRHVDRDSRHRGIRTIDQHKNLRALPVKQLVGIIHRDLDPDARIPADNRVVHVVIALNVANDMKRVRISQPIQQLPAFASSICVENDGVHLSDVGVNPESEKHHLQQRNNQRKEQRPKVPPHVQDLLIKDRFESTKRVTHERPPAAPDACKSARRKHLPGWVPAAESLPPRCRFSKAARANCRVPGARQSKRVWTVRKSSRCVCLEARA